MGTNNIAFVTITCNQDWPFLRDFAAGYEVGQRFDIVTRVFQAIRIKVLINITNGCYTPNNIHSDYHNDTNEWQMRKLPHTHSISHFPGRPWTTVEIDQIMFTHIPTIEEEMRLNLPGLRALVLKFMIHHHTTACQKHGPCRWKFPQCVNAVTHCDESGTWHTWRGADDVWVVPYNPHLLWQFQGHVCLIACAGTAAIGYLFKYPFKGDTHARCAIRRAHTEAACVSPDNPPGRRNYCVPPKPHRKRHRSNIPHQRVSHHHSITCC